MTERDPDSMSTFGQCWLKGVRYFGQRSMPTLGQCHFAHRANVGPQCWLNVGPTLQVICFNPGLNHVVLGGGYRLYIKIDIRIYRQFSFTQITMTQAPCASTLAQ